MLSRTRKTTYSPPSKCPASSETFYRDHERQTLKLETSWLVMLSFKGLNRQENEKMRITIICNTYDLLKTWNVKP